MNEQLDPSSESSELQIEQAQRESLQLEAITKTEFESSLAQSVMSLIASGGITVDSSYKGFTVDGEKSVLALQAVEAARSNEITPDFSQSTELSPELVHQNYREVLQAFLEAGLISGEFMGQVSRIIKPSGIKPSNSEFARFFYLEDTFPKSADRRGSIEIGTKVVEYFEEKLQEASEKVGIILSAEQRQKLILRTILSHEYGHAVHHTLAIQRVENALENDPEASFISVVVEQSKSLDTTIHNTTAPEELHEFFHDEEIESLSGNDPQNTVSERIATGFKEQGMRLALQEMGIEPEKAQALIDTLAQDDSKKLDEYRLTLKYAQERGFSMKTLAQAVSYVSTDIRKDHPDLAEKIRGGFGSRNLGYFFPLTAEQLKEIQTL